MKNLSLALLSLVVTAPLYASVGEHLIPAGSLIQCTVAEPRISSRTTAIGDPIMCQVGHAERYGRSVLPTESYLVGRFEDYKDPGHFVGKGWMELKFDRMVIEPNTVIPIDARVVDVPGYKVDNQGRILGKGHVKRDIFLWSVPVLWPVDMLMLPMRGPRPTLKEETRLTLKVMDDLTVPPSEPLQRDPYGLVQRPPTAYNEVPPAPYPDPAPYADQPQDQGPMPTAEDYPPPMPVAPPPPAYAYAPPPAYYAPPPAYYGYVAPPAIGFSFGYGYGIAPGVRAGYGYGYNGYGYRAPLSRGYGYGGGYVARPAPRYGYGAAPQRVGGGAMMRSPGASMAMRGGGAMAMRGGGARMAVRGR